jgi:hypothetical protein
MAMYHSSPGCKYVQGGAYNIYIIWDIFDWSSDYQDFSEPTLSTAGYSLAAVVSQISSGPLPAL